MLRPRYVLYGLGFVVKEQQSRVLFGIEGVLLARAGTLRESGNNLVIRISRQISLDNKPLAIEFEAIFAREYRNLTATRRPAGLNG